VSQDGRDLPLDGLRGLAILLVVLYHATLFGEANASGAEWLAALPRWGWAGVDLFFVLSGFLITRILVRERAAANYFGVFYARRVLRIFPLYYLVLAVFFIATPDRFWLPGGSRDTFWYWLYLSNVETALTGAFHHRFLDLTWSLAIEEQFYLVWPLLVWWLAPRRLEALCIAAIGAAFALRCAFVLSGAHPLAVYVLTPFRMDCLAAGALVALVAEREGWTRLERIARALLPAAFAVCAALYALYRFDPSLLAPRPNLTLLAHPLVQTLGYSALATLFAALLVRAMTAGSRGAWRALEARPLLVLGHYSYAIYLLHDPAIALTTAFVYDPRRTPWPYPLEQLIFYALVLALSLAAAALSWRVLEGPAVRLGHRLRYR
jgi:peptidoglycan/LPS O-acetylase OafA/YrhL